METLYRVTKEPQETRLDKLSAEVKAKVAEIPDLDPDQAQRVYEIALGYAFKNHREPNYQGIANLVRSQAERPTPSTFEANGKQI
jgi:hypothetical protein